MNLNEIFGLGKKKPAREPEWGSLQERKDIVTKILQFGYDTFAKPDVSTKIMMIIRELIKKDRVDLVAIHQNDIMRDSLVSSVATNHPLETLQAKFDEMKKAFKGE